MKDRLQAGIISGFAAGLIMGFFVWLGYQSSLLNFNPFYIIASVFLPDELAVGRVGTLTAIVAHLIISVIIGIIFSYVVSEKRAVFWGIALGFFLNFFFGAIVTPAFTPLMPFWDMDTMNIIYTLIMRMVYGFSLGYLYTLWLARHPEPSKTVA